MAHGGQALSDRLVEGSQQRALAESALNCLETDGFIRLPLEDVRTVAAAVRAWDAWLASAPAEAKLRHARAAAPTPQRAPTPLGGPPPGGRGYVSLPAKELFEVVLDDQLAARALLALHSQGASMLSMLSRALGMQPHGLSALLDELPLAPNRDGSSVLHVCRYTQSGAAAGSSRGGGGSAATQGTEAHQDRGLLTVVAASEGEGLEVQSRHDGSWRRVVLWPGEAAMFCGLSLEWATGGMLKAAVHRVVPLAPGRTSLCYKLRVRPDAVVDPPALLQYSPGHLRPSYQAPKTGAQLMEMFAASHPLSVNAQALGSGGGDGSSGRAEGEATGHAQVETLRLDVVVLTNPQHKLSLQLPAGSALLDAKRAVASATDVPLRRQLLFSGSWVSLPDDTPLAHLERRLGRPLKLYAAPSPGPQEPTMRINCMGFDGAKIEFDLRVGATGIELMVLLQARACYHPTKQMLIFDGERVHPMPPLAELGIGDGDSLDILDKQYGD
ncbi:hypothetical protein Rsub_12245 [Raphidocelis subcapitata]|uniref:Ubiquitin-like domain-containing protein n=1 Tax=Raphidocelis subcapitata TaxID=307507 RepID=A0A2V0PMX9_9CHLO|nr:hypothetical protein Rsub_12245 [Raphidocelis subcapitata]|eukprot:GBF99413.1 hypothetical protein Rsub_12245 [Raphidocelis subcapitata]